jgi:HPr kinase/phosphorylase
MKISKTQEKDEITVGELFQILREPLKMELVNSGSDLTREVGDYSINRPALALMGHFAYFANTRLQLLGAGEMAFIYEMPPSHQYEVFEILLAKSVPGIVISKGQEPTHPMIDVCRSHATPVFKTELNSNDFTTSATLQIRDILAPKVSIYGTLMDVNGMGVLILGESGIGKSDCALALIKNGHSLIADDLVYVKRIGNNPPIGTCSELSRGYMECRGIGIINIAQLFGIHAVRKDKKIDLVAKFREASVDIAEDRTGLDTQTVDILGVDVPLYEIPVRPGRDMAKLVEVSALVHASKVMGYNGAKDFNDNLIRHMETKQGM